MVDALPHILGETEIDLPKIIFGLIFFIIWALSALVSWLTKRQQEVKRRAAQVRDRLLPQGSATQERSRPAPRIAEGLAQRFPDVMLPPAPPVPQQQRQQRPIPPAAPKPLRRAPKPQQRRAVPVFPSAPMEEIARMAPSSVNITQPAARRKAPTVDARAVKTFLTPATLRQQFILTEIFQPPLALRPEPPHRASPTN